MSDFRQKLVEVILEENAFECWILAAGECQSCTRRANELVDELLARVIDDEIEQRVSDEVREAEERRDFETMGEDL